MGVQIGTIMLAVTALAALAGAIIGALAWWRSRTYPIEESRLLIILGHHCLEPVFTLGVGCIALFPPNGRSVFLSIFSLLSIFAPWLFRLWDSHWLRSHNQALRWWALARFGTCALVWISLITAGDLSGSGEAPMLGVTTVIGTLVLWGSLIHSVVILRDFPAIARPLGAVGSEAG